MSLLKHETDIYESEEMEQIHKFAVPGHIAIIMDGNRRWAKKRFMPAFLGHWKGADNITQIVKAAKQLGVKVLTVFAFSTENWSRPQREIDELMEIFQKFLTDKKQMLLEKGIKLDVIGDIAKMPPKVQNAISDAKNFTSTCTEMELVLALSYGGRDDLRRAIGKMYQDLETKKLPLEAISESLISSYLDTSKWQDPDLLIRTSGENRLSNFLLWQISYTEIYVTDVLWPDFNHEEFLKAIIDYQQRKRRLGG